MRMDLVGCRHPDPVKESTIMKAKTLAILIAFIALVLFLLVPSLSWIGYGGAIHKSKARIGSSEKA
jgi:hypothetical protein